MLPGRSVVSQAMASPCCLLLCAVGRGSGVKISPSNGEGQDNGDTRQFRNKTVCVGCTEKYLSLFICLLTLCSASVNALQFVFSNSSYESTAKWETWQIFKEDRLLMRI